MKTDTICFHCGEECEQSPPVIYDQKSFCCNGCQVVYSLLHENNLCNYYDIEKTPGISFKKKNSTRYEYLNDPLIQKQLIQFKDSISTHTTLHLPQIHCHSCLWLLEKLPSLYPSILSSRVNYLKKEVSIRFDHKTSSLTEVVEQLSQLGYEPKITLSDKEKTTLSRNYALYYKLGITGFCFGNMMLLSFPEYLSDNFREMEQSFSFFFGILNLLLALPVLLYGAIDYLKSGILSIKHHSINIDVPISLGIVSIFLVSSYEILSATGSGYFDSLGGLIFFLLLGKIFQQSTFDHLSFERDYTSYFPIAVTRINNSTEENIPFHKIKVGDHLQIHHDEIIPADSTLLSPLSSIDYSFVTGESKPEKIIEGQTIYAGGKQKNGSITVLVSKKPSQSYLTQLWNQESDLTDEKSLEKLSNLVSKYFTILILLIATIAGIYWLQESIEKSLHVFTAILIIACPCALALSIPFTMGNATRILGKHHFYVKHPNIIDVLGHITHIIFDKTGTLTEVNKSTILYKGIDLNDKEKQSIYSLSKQSNHPLSQSLSRFLSLNLLDINDYQEIHGRGLTGVIDNQQIKIGSAAFLNQETHENQTAIHVSINQEYKGFFSFSNSYRKGLDQTINTLKKRFQLSVVSGDSNAEKQQLRSIFGMDTALMFKQNPFDKLQYVQNLQNKGEKVLMLGDGLNDAGALKYSNVGIAITDELSNFTPSSDIIMGAAKLTFLPLFIRYAKQCRTIILFSFTLSFCYNIIGLYFGITGSLSPFVAAILMPASSISVMLFTTIATTVYGWKFDKKESQKL